MVVFDESNVIDAKIDKLTSLIGKIYSAQAIQIIQTYSLAGQRMI